MGLLDPVPERYTPPSGGRRSYRSPHDGQSAEDKLSELNNLGRGEVTEDYSDSLTQREINPEQHGDA